MLSKLLTRPFALFAIAALSMIASCNTAREGYEEENEEYDGPQQAMEQEIERTKDPAIGTVPWERLYTAIRETEVQKSVMANSQNAVASLNWVERGPYSDVVGPSNGNTRANNGVTSGRMRTIMIDSLDPAKKTVWVAGVSGGLWKTTDITASPANWILINDFMVNLAVSDICQDPRPGNQNIMYACTGESYGNAFAVRGVGVFKSVDAGATWNLLPSTTSYTAGTRILCDNLGNVYLATRTPGLMRSTDGGSTWTNITPSGLSTSICDLELSNTGRLHVVSGIFTAQAYRYTDAPATVTSATWDAPVTPFPSFNMRAEIGVLGNTLYAAPANASYQVPTLYKSTDGGANWAATTGNPPSTWASGQGWYGLTVTINPSNPNDCIVGGLDNYRTLDGGSTWTKISYWVGTTGQYVHADQHDLQWWDGGNKLAFACDGGIHFSSDGGTTIRDRNVGLRLKQFYSVAVHPTTTDYFLAGAQDNGTHQLTQAGLGTSVEVTGGDGAYTAIDQNEPQYQFGAYVYNQYRRSTNGGASWSSVNFSSTAGRFINPFEYDDVQNKIYAAYGAGQYLLWDNPQTGSTNSVVSVTEFQGKQVSAIHVSPYTANRVYFGAGNVVVRVDNANTTSPTGTDITPAASGYVNCIVTGTSEQNIMAIYNNYGVNNVWLSNNGGTTWTACDGNLPDMPVRWALFDPNDNTKAFIATETGVWETTQLNGASTVWTPNPSFPNVSTHMLRYRASDGLIAASTYGRGVWTAILTASCTPASISNQPANVSVCAGNNASFSIGSAGTAPLQYQWQVNTGSGWTNIAGATGNTYSFTALASQNGYQYRVIVTGNCAPTNATSNAATLTVQPATAISAQPASVSSCPGTAASFSVATTGGTPTYQWQVSTDGCTTFTNLSNGGIYSGVTTNTLNISSTNATLNNYSYRVIMTTPCNIINSQCATLTVTTVPSITQQPVSQTICDGNTASFTVATSAGAAGYQWQVNTGSGWTDIAGATNTTYSFTATVAQTGYQYRARVTGACSTILTSDAVTLTVGAPLSITSQPSAATICETGSTSFSVSTAGIVNSYQWQVSTNGGTTWTNVVNNATYAGATTATLSLTGITASMNQYQYHVVVVGSCPGVTSNAAILTVNTAPQITTQPTASTICSGQNTVLSVAASGSGSLTYQWQVSTGGGPFTNVANGTNYSGATTSSLTISNAPLAFSGNVYRVVITGICSPAATSSSVALTVNTAIAIASQPSAVTVCELDATSFSVTATGTNPVYQWQVSTDGGTTWTNITNSATYSGATTAALGLANVSATMNQYRYRVVINGSCSSSTSNAALLSVNTAPKITAQPVATTLCEGQTTLLGITATGSGALSYQWQVSVGGGAFTNVANGTNYAGATTATLSILSAPASFSGNVYRVVVNGICNPTATSSSVAITVNTPISISAQPVSVTTCEQNAVSFSVTAGGTSPAYQWQVSTDGGITYTNIAGANTNTYSINSTTLSMNGNRYRVLINGTAPCSSLSSNAAILNVSARPIVQLVASPYTRLFPGLTTTLTVTSNVLNPLYQWYYNNVAVSGFTGSTMPVTVNELGNYKVAVTNATGCSQTSNIVTIADSVTNRMHVYPNPNRGQFRVWYYNTSANGQQYICAFDDRGAMVDKKPLATTVGTQVLAFDLRKHRSGLYYLSLVDDKGHRIHLGEVVVLP